MLDYTGSAVSFSIETSRRYSNGQIAWRGFWITELLDCGGSVTFCSGFVCDLPDQVSLCVYLSVLRKYMCTLYNVLCTQHVELV